VLSYKIFTCLVPQGLGELARQSVKINVDTQDGSWGQTPLSPWRWENSLKGKPPMGIVYIL